MVRKAMVVDLDRCIGCDACIVACKQENGVPLGSYWTRVATVGPTGKFPDVEMYYLPVMCQQCQNPPCVSSCPSGASFKRPDGIVLVDKAKCIGAQACIKACPYGVRFWNPEQKVTEKCTGCVHLLEAGKEPACVTACCTKARVFGDLDDPNSAASKIVAKAGNTNVHKLPDVGNKPNGSFILNPDIAKWRSS